ncbi:MAG TPA: GNAT family N-acetyltransferase [Tepidisphaeraceae bacterium]|nr:GNAT family N-acetyltransferase [Tepidisphaeraceae bacterium]
MHRPIQVRRCQVSEIIDLRWRILRAGLARETAFFDGDNEPTTYHFAAEDVGRIVGCATLLRRLWQDMPAWQLRGMAVEPALQGRGVGSLLLKMVDQTVRLESHSMQLWCNARSPAVQFYRKSCWETFGDEFDIPTAGPHLKMTKLLTKADRITSA